MKTTHLIVTSCAVLLVACGGGGGGGNGGGNANQPPPQPAPQQKVGGIFTGTITVCSPPECPIDTFVLVSERGEYLTQDLEFRARPNAGQMTVNGGGITGSRRLYNAITSEVKPFGYVPISPPQADSDNLNRSIRGAVIERQSIDGNFVHSGSANVEIHITYDAQYEKDSSLATIAGMYSADDGAGYALTYVIDAAGAITGSDSTGCTVSGNIGIIDADFNMYSTDLAFSACGPGGADGAGYTGLATLRVDPVTMQETLYFYAATDAEIIILDLPRI